MRKLVGTLLAVVLGGAIALAVPQMVRAQAAASATEQTGTITGKVVDSSGNPVGGAKVQVIRMPSHPPRRHMNPNKVQPGQTDWIKRHVVVGITKTADNGTFTINNAPVGKYRVAVMARGVGRGWVRKPVTVTSGSTADAGTITLHKPHPRRHGPPPGH